MYPRKESKKRFTEIMGDTSWYWLGATDLEIWKQQQKEITERLHREEQEEAYLMEHWFEQEAYVNDTLFKRLWMRIQYALRNTRGAMPHSKIPKHVIEEMARCLLPDMIVFYETKEGREAFEKWKAERHAEKTEKSKVAS